MNASSPGLSLRGFRVLLLDLDPQAQVTQWLHAGDGFSVAGTLAAVFNGEQITGGTLLDQSFAKRSRNFTISA